MDFRASPKRLFPSSSSNYFYRNVNGSYDMKPKHFSRAKNTDYTSDRASQRSQSRSQQARESYQMEEEFQNQMNIGQSPRYQGQVSEASMVKMLTVKQEKAVQLKQRLKNIHHFYRIRIEQERSKNLQRNEIFIGVIEELQKNHSEKIINLQNSLEDMDQQKKGIGYVDERMGSIQDKIEDILAQSKQLKSLNESMEKDIIQKENVIKQKESQYLRMKEQIDELRNKLQLFERAKLKQNKRNKELVDLIDSAF